MKYKFIAYLAYAFVFFAGLTLLSGCSQKDSETSAFTYDQAAITAAKPWSSETFRNNSDDFQFAIIGDRTGGANVQGTFEIAMNQLNLMQPEFVINVGDIIEGYTRNKTELNTQWEEVEAMTAKLEMPFFLSLIHISEPTRPKR